MIKTKSYLIKEVKLITSISLQHQFPLQTTLCDMQDRSQYNYQEFHLICPIKVLYVLISKNASITHLTK